MFSEMIVDRVKENPLVKKYIKGEFTEKIYFLNAEGGYGKSTSFKSLYYYLVEQGTQANNHIVPILVDVKSLTAFGEEGVAGNMPRPIEKYIVKNYCGADSDPNESLLEKEINIFSKKNAPKSQNDYTYCIFIDAINEVNDRLKGIIVDEIKQMVESDSVKFFISSRVNESSLPDDTVKYKLLPLDEDKIRVYLDKNFGKTGEKVDIRKINDSLVDILRVPMYLSVFRETYDEKTPYPDIYEAKAVRKTDILDSFIQKLLDDNKGKERSADKAVIEFVVKYFLPALAFLMANTNGFIIDSDSTEKLNYDYFKKFFKGTKKEVIKNLMNSEAYNPLSICCKTFSILIENRDNFSFTHQNWQDLFVAKHIINCMNAEKLDELGTPVSENVCQFVGELIREHKDGCGYSKDYMDQSDEEKARKSECDFEEKDNLKVFSASPVEDFLQKHNLKSQSPLSAMATKNLIDIMKTSRNGNITAKYDDLDLKKVAFHDCNLQASTFERAKIYEHSFFASSAHTNKINVVAFDPNGEYLASGSDDRTIMVWDTTISNQSPITTLKGHVGTIKAIAFSPRDRIIASGSDDCSVRLWSIETGKAIGGVLKGHEGAINSVAFSPNGELLVSGSDDNTICIWNVDKIKNGTEDRKTFVGSHEDSVTQVSFLKTGEILSCSLDDTIRIWKKTENGQWSCKIIGKHTSEDEISAYLLVCKYLSHPCGTRNIICSYCDNLIISACNDRCIYTWDMLTGELLSSCEFGFVANSLIILPDNKRIVAGSSCGMFLLCIENKQVKYLEKINSLPIYSLSLSSDGKSLVGSTEGLHVLKWAIKYDELAIDCNIVFDSYIGGYKEELSIPKNVSFSYDDNYIVIYTDNEIVLREVATGKCAYKLVFSEESRVSFSCKSTKGKYKDYIHDGLNSTILSSDKKILASGGAGKPVRIWDAVTGRKLWGQSKSTLYNTPQSAYYNDLHAYVDDNNFSCIKLSYRGSSNHDLLLGYHSDTIESVSFSQDGKRLITASADKTIRIWNIESNYNIRGPLVGHKDTVIAASFSFDGKKIISSSKDGTLRIWYLNEGYCRIIYLTRLPNVYDCDFSNSIFQEDVTLLFYNFLSSKGGILKKEKNHLLPFIW